MQTPSPDKSTQPQRREPLRWMAAAALLLAFLSICCIAQVVTFLLAPRNQRSNLDLRSKLLADYAPWNIDLPLPGIGPEVPAAQAADLATATSLALLGTSTPVIVGALPTAELAIVPPVANAPTPTPVVFGTIPPAPTASPAIAGGATTRTPTRAPTSTPTESGATAVDTPRPTSASTPTDTREPQPSRTPTSAPATSTSDRQEATNTPKPQPATDTPKPQPATDTPQPQPATNTPQPPPPATNTPQPTLKPTDKPPKTSTPTLAPTASNTPTRAPTASNTPTRAPTASNTPITPSPTASNTPITPSPTATDTPITPSPTPSDTPTPTVGTIAIVKVPSADPTTNNAAFQYVLTITNNAGAPIDINQISDSADAMFTVLNCNSPQGGACNPPIGSGAPSIWTGPITLANNASMQLVIDGIFTGVPPGTSVCNTSFTIDTSVGSVTRNNTACVTVN